MYGEPYLRFEGHEHTAFLDPGLDVQIAFNPQGEGLWHGSVNGSGSITFTGISLH